MRHELVEREDVGEGSLDDDVATSVTLHFTKQDPVAMWLRSTASCKNGLLCSAEQKNDNEAVERVLLAPPPFRQNLGTRERVPQNGTG